MSTEAESLFQKTNYAIDYKKTTGHFAGARFIYECTIKLKTSVTTTAIACTYYHRFFNVVEVESYDPYTIGTTCIYIASKVTNDDLKVRDIVNVALKCLHPEDDPLSMDPYLALRDSMMFTELLIMRVLGFKLEVDLPHRYLLHYLTALEDWLGKETFQKVPIIRTSWSLLLDSFHAPLMLKYSPQLLSASVLHLTLQIYGIIVPGCDELGEKPWYGVLNPDCTTSYVWEVISSLIKLYDFERELRFLKPPENNT